MPSKRRAFTLLEILIAIGIIAVLVGILVPVLAQARRKAIRTSDLSSMHQLGLAFSLYQQNEGGMAYGPPQLVATGYIPKSICASEEDPTDIGLANECLLHPLASMSGDPSLAVPYKLTYIGLREARVNHDLVDKYVKDNNGGGWLIDCTETNREGIFDELSWTGRYKRLMFDGSVQNRVYQKIDCGGGPSGGVEPCFTQILLFTDPDDKIRQWMLSTK